jgi:protein-disulfide isomerase
MENPPVSKFANLRNLKIASPLAFVALFLACNSGSASGKPKMKVIEKPSPKAGIVAKIGDVEITEEELVGDSKMEVVEAEKRVYDLKKQLLRRVAIEKIYGPKAKEKNISTAEYVEKNVVKGDPKISDADYKKFVQQNNVPEEQATRMKDRIMEFMKEQKRNEAVDADLAKQTAKSPIEFYVMKPKVKVDVDPGNGPSMGNKDAKVKVVIFSDFQCPFCARGASTVHEIKKRYGKDVQITFRHLPLPMHPQARPAAEASMCVNDQGSEKFWKFHDIVFKNQQKLSDEDLAKYAADAGADKKKYEECYKSKKTRLMPGNLRFVLLLLSS